MEWVSLSERMAEERLSNNSNVIYCRQCEKCAHWNNEDVWSNKFSKSSCKKYKYPNFKPSEVINNRSICKYRKEVK